jgi:hypothetical protein
MISTTDSERIYQINPNASSGLRAKLRTFSQRFSEKASHQLL